MTHMFDITFSPYIFILLIYVLSINVITVVTFAHDKSRARTTKRRVSERTLLTLALLGGTPAALYAMNTFRHKTKKISFQLYLILILCAQIATLVALWSLVHNTNTSF